MIESRGDRRRSPMSMWSDPDAVHWVDGTGVSWRVVERGTTEVPGARGPRCLIFLSEAVVRRVWTYPSDWQHLSATDLEALTDDART